MSLDPQLLLQGKSQDRFHDFVYQFLSCTVTRTATVQEHVMKHSVVSTKQGQALGWFRAPVLE